MAKLAELVRTMPESWARAAKKETLRSNGRKKTISNYQACMAELEKIGSEGLFAACKGAPCRKRCKNRVSTEREGRLGMRISVKRWSGSYITNTCRVVNI